MQALIVLTLLLASAATVLSQPPVVGDNHECPKRKPGTPGSPETSVEDLSPEEIPNKPLLPNQFEVTVEANILSSGFSNIVKEYYDFDRNQGAVHYMGLGNDYHVYYDFANLQEFRVSDGKCETLDLNEETREDSPLEFYSTTGSGHVQSIQEMLRWGPDYKLKYMGEDEVRGIPVNRWETCFRNTTFGIEGNTLYDFALNFFFTLNEEYEGPFGSNNSYPVRIEIDGNVVEENRDFMHYYDFVSFKPGPVSDPSVFAIPRGVYCPGRKKTKPMPKLDSMFTIYGEIIDHDLTSVNQFEEHYDGQLNLNSITVTPSKDWESRPKKDNPALYHNAMTIIDDFNSGFSYFIDNKLKNCTVYALKPGQMTTAQVAGSNRIRMKTSREMLKLDNDYAYVGERMWRGIPVNVWSSMTNITDKDGKQVAVPTEAYFSRQPWRYNAADQSQKEVLVGQYFKFPEGEKDFNLFGYHAGHTDLNVYDISLCYPNKNQRRRFMAQLDGEYNKLVKDDNLSFMEQALKLTVSKTAGVRPIRVTGISFDETTVGRTDAWFTILDKPPNEKVLIENPESALGDSSLDDAEKLLRSATSMVLTVQIPADDKMKVQKINVVSGTMTTSKDIMKGVPIVTKTTETKKTGHSNGAMAGLAIGMIILGAVLGLGIALFLWRRRMEIPYITTD